MMKRLSYILALALLASACSTTRQSKPLAFAGDGRSTVGALQASIGKRGYKPVCKEREYCKFAYGEEVWIHFKARARDVVLAIDVAKGAEMPADKRNALVAEATAVAESIWGEASADAKDRERQVAAKEKADAEARVAEQRARDEAERKAEAQRKAASDAQPGSSGVTFGGILGAVGGLGGAASNGGGAGGGSARCCVNRAYYDCPSPSAVNKCAGETAACFARCMQSSDMGCPDRCAREHPPDPSGCTRVPAKDGDCPK